MGKIKKCVFITFLEVFKEKGCVTIDDIIKMLNEELENDADTIFEWKGI